MPEATDAVLITLVEAGPFRAYRIDGPRDSADARYLGVVGLADSHATFHVIDHFPFAGTLSPDSRFEIRNLRRSGHPTIVFVVFRQFDSSRFQASPEDIVAGWVPEDEAAVARGWVDDMNHLLRMRLRASREAEAVNAHFAIRTKYEGSLAAVLRDVERVLGCMFYLSTNPGYDGQEAFEATWDGLLISLVEDPPVGEIPRRIRMTGNPDRNDLPHYTSEIDLSPRMLDLLALTDAEWYVASEEELRAE